MADTNFPEPILVGDATLHVTKEGKLDHLVLGAGLACTLQVERLGDDRFWLGVYPRGEPDRRIEIELLAKDGKIESQHRVLGPH